MMMGSPLLQISKIMSNSRANRPSPSESATLYPIGCIKNGNDGGVWIVTTNSNNVKRWVPYISNGTPITLSVPIPKFQIGDCVRIKENGYGCSPQTVGNIVNILDVRIASPLVSYRIDKEFYDSNGFRQTNEWIDERSFELVQIPTLSDEEKSMLKTKRMAKSKNLNKRQAQDVRVIETSLINKEEVFKMLALAESTGLPCLLVGSPGVAKTKTVIEYAKAWLNRDGKMTAKDFAEKIYVLETDEGTKASEIKGMPDLGRLFTENKYELAAPIAEAEIVIINEVDKASSAIRNAMLGVMNEKFLFNGKHKIPCKWKLFVATCNEIPKDEMGSPFWDRFMLKMVVNRVSASDIVKYYKSGDRNYKETIKIGVPNKQEIDSFEVPVQKLEKYLEVAYRTSSDRTLTFVPKLTKAVSFIWDCSIDKALVKTAQIMISQSAGSELQNKLMSPEVKAVMSKVEMLQSHNTQETLSIAVAEIEGLINAYASRGIMDELQVEEIEQSISFILQNHPVRLENDGDLEDVMESEQGPSESGDMVMEAGSF